MNRDIDRRGFIEKPDEPSIDMGNALPTELILLQGEQGDDPCLILDVAESEPPHIKPRERRVDLQYSTDTIRRFDPLMPQRMPEDDYLKNDWDPDRRAESTGNHRNWPAVNAGDYLASILANFDNAHWIPTCDGVIWAEDFRTPWVTELRRRFMEDYGWPDNLRREAWQQEASEMAMSLMSG